MLTKRFVQEIERKTVWKIKRYGDESDAKRGRIYEARAALELFGKPQITYIRGGVLGAVANSDILFKKLQMFFASLRQNSLKEFKHFMKDFMRTFKHLFTGNVMLNEGINELWTLVCSSSGTEFDNTNAYLGVGDDTTAESATQDKLQAEVNATNYLYKAMDSGYPTYGSDQKATWRATFGGSDANFSWQEFTVANGSSGTAKNLNRKVSDQGTKTSGQQWQLELSITLS